ncbi:glutaminyl-peptide cyclotransferase [Caulobacter sp. S45]|uniref:glutaminyl-peptide cyclotransferase n=1 Tax=Caulobacter sp. S45 TaxID=1641861 RepID=UPI0020C5D68F|nr:glutaminyl-peptide cyclotransferase [Caulobacter sp. S45]
MGFKTLLASLLIAAAPLAACAATPVYTYQVVRTFPHDVNAFTEGLFYEDGVLWESTGLPGHSFVRRERLDTGEVLQQHDLPAADFGEGIVRWGGRLYQLTWQEHFGYVYDARTLSATAKFPYPGEGWALTKDAHHIYMSDGTPDLRVLDPVTMREERRIHVTDDGRPVQNLNELEWVKGEIYADIWQTSLIACIDPATGHVVGWIDLAGLLPQADVTPGRTDVLNGIAYDAAQDRLFVTGKNWPKLFQIRLQPRP